MEDNFHLDKTFGRHDSLSKGEYENCTFNSCLFIDNNLSGYKFINCSFHDCNLSVANIHKTIFQDVQFKNCKMLGLQFNTCNEFGLSFSFDGCQLNHCSFYKTKIKKTVFKNCQLQESDFSETDLSYAVFDNCNLEQSTFDHSNLENTDFRTAYHYSIDPVNNRIKKAKFSLQGLPGLLEKYNIQIVE